MTETLLPWKILSANVSLGLGSEGWALDTDLADDGGSRSYQTEILFAEPFQSVPVVQVGLTGFDIDQRDSARIVLRAEDICCEGFRVVLTTWSGTRVYGVDFQWMAIGA